MKSACLVLAMFSVWFSSGFAATYEQELGRLSMELGDGLQKAGIKTVAVVNFKNLQGKETDLCKLLAEELPVNLINQKQGLTVVDRTNLDRIMSEQKLTEEGLINPENSKKLKLAGIDALIYGTITLFDSAYRINIKSLNTESATMVAAVRGSLAQSDNLDSLMGLKKSQTESIGETIQLPKSASEDDALKKQRVYDLGGVSVEIKAVELFKKSGKVRVTYIVTNKGQGGYGCAFTYHLVDKNNPPELTGPGYQAPYTPKPPNFELIGGASDDKGNTYKSILPPGAASYPRMDQGTKLSLQIEYKLVAEGSSSVQVPDTFSFWFEFYVGYITYHKDSTSLYKVSVVDCAFDKKL